MLVVVGDIHAKIQDLDDCRRLIDGLIELRQTKLSNADPDLVFLGDQTHDHTVIRLEVADFWRKALSDLAKHYDEIYWIVGNHEIATSGEITPNAGWLIVDNPRVVVVDRPTVVGDVTFFPYFHDREAFREASKNMPCKYLFCHQTFDGAKYDNGFYAQDGVAFEDLPVEKIFSGHIHTPYEFGKVTYVGSPRWMTSDDANQNKRIMLFNETTGEVKYVGTEQWCSPLRTVNYSQGDEQPIIPANARVTVVLSGDNAWIDQEALKLKTAGCVIRKNIRSQAAPRVDSNKSVSESFVEFVSNFKTANGTDPKVLKQIIQELSTS